LTLSTPKTVLAEQELKVMQYRTTSWWWQCSQINTIYVQ